MDNACFTAVDFDFHSHLSSTFRPPRGLKISEDKVNIVGPDSIHLEIIKPFSLKRYEAGEKCSTCRICMHKIFVGKAFGKSSWVGMEVRPWQGLQSDF